MKRLHKMLLALVVFVMIALLSLLAGPVYSSAKDTKSTGKKCSFCHDGSPKDGTLTEEGECYKKNGNKQGDCW